MQDIPTRLRAGFAVNIILQVLYLFLDLQEFFQLRQIITQVMTIIKPWQVACDLQRLYWSTTHSHKGMQQSKHFNIPYAQYDLR